jgi:glycoside/pentoside/hexuronide:cation symporter, GPH family
VSGAGARFGELVAAVRDAPAFRVLLGLVVVTGVAYAGLQVFPPALLPDLIAAEGSRTATTRAGVFAGVWTAGETLGLALGPGLFGLGLAFGGYVAGADPGAARVGVDRDRGGFAVLPAVQAAVTLFPLRSRLLELPSQTGE